MAQLATGWRLVDFEPVTVWLLEQVLQRRSEDPVACMKQMLEDTIKVTTYSSLILVLDPLLISP